MEIYKLNPCPICKGEVEIRQYTDTYYNYPINYIYCHRCNLSYGRHIYKNADLKKLIRSWNRRFK